ncbi:hypothetical protein GXP67_22700 [Rhodocytophaga rosea]|uniref:Uncharacterized protein n=1 Tax=Rhodocytophaga rosea TaxID=2704465 RepID=A0A6C0GN23_9BACT|nr:hypothetical protein [Rhodocytophaga rosea]QHT69244.1 hypothetical protein GXP67_22700 [Rhodocytophaga rosea]
MNTFGKYYLVLVLFLYSLQVCAQVENNLTAAPKKSSRSEKRVKPRIKTPEVSIPLRIVVTDIRNIGYGNRCVGEATQKVGFVYVPMPIQEVERKSRFYYFLHNQSAKLKLTLKNGPFWHKKLKKSIKRCLQSTGDFTG